ncbi:MAG: GNAT family N-acetyltransferase, partial [Cellulomonas sp.]|nr:GNAT family N-acetyltransferase [Cellulomonas sp.]
AGVHVRSWQEAYAGIVPAEYLDSLDVVERTSRWADLLDRGPADHVATWVAVVGSDVIGFASVGPARDEDARQAEREIYSIYLDPGTWGHGVARELMRTLIAQAGDRGLLSLWVLADNERAQHFYRRHGFTPDGVERYEEVGGAELLQVRYRR